MFEDYYRNTIKQIRKAATNALSILSLSWSFNVSEPVMSTQTGIAEWKVSFFDDHNNFRCVQFDPPPQADENWYTREIIRQLREQLALSQ